MKELKTYTSFSPFSILLVFVALMIIGAGLIPLLNIQLNPSRTSASIRVDYDWSGASARIIEQEVTSKLEGMFSVMTGLKDISSASSEGRGNINMSFKKSINLDAARFEISTIIRRAYPQLPEDVSYPGISLRTGGSKKTIVLTYMLTSGADSYFIQQYAENTIVPKLSVIQGVNEVSVYGATPFKYEITFDLQKSRILGISGDEIANAIDNYFRRDIVGIVQSEINQKGNPEEFRVSFQTTLNESLDWNKIPVKSYQGRIIHLSDLAHVVYKEAEPSIYYRINGLNTINLVVFASEGVNNIKMAQEVKSEMDKIIQFLPSGNSILLAYDATRYLHADLVKIGLRTLYSVLTLLAFVWIISRKLQYLLFITASLLANLVIAVIFYYLLKLEIHLYSLAGITVSFGIIIDNSIVMIDHYRHRGDKKAFLAILAATLTTIGSLCIIFFLNEKQRLNLVDFTWVMIVNLGISLLIALLFIPSMLELTPLITKKSRLFFRRKRRVIKTIELYIQFVRFSKRWRLVFIILLILGFGIPVHWLPTKAKTENRWGNVYNKTIGTEFYQRIRPVTEKIVGGTLRLFSENVFDRSFYSDPERTALHIRGSMPEGCTVQQLNEAIKKMENYLNSIDEIELYQTNIISYNNSSIAIYFKPEYETGSFPFNLKGILIDKAISLGGLTWNVYGVGQGFNNAINPGVRSYQIELNGYNYDQLYRYAKILYDSLEKHPRIQDLEISGETSWKAKTLHEFVIDFDREAFAIQDINLQDYFHILRDEAFSRHLSPVFNQGEKIPVILVSDKSEIFDKWTLNNEPVQINNKIIKFNSIGNINKRKTGNAIYKYNQEYRLYVLFNYIGPSKFARIVTDNATERMNSWLPMGYKASSNRGYWSQKDEKQYYLIFLVIGIIYFLCAILLESLIQPLAIIAMIPISFIGVFLTFYLFDINFDQGGMAAFILLCGLSVNSALYIINDYNIFRKLSNSGNGLRTYIKAFNHKITPVILTIISTIFGLIPFIIGGQTEIFWFAFAVGTIGGLIFSLLALLIYFPLFLNLAKSKTTI